MTISEAATKYRYEGNASTDTFAFSGKAFTASDLVVEIITRATDVLEETLTLTTDYSVTINTDGTASIVTVAGKIPSATQDIQIRRDLEKKQETSLPVGTPFPAKSVENAIDRSIGIIQEQDEAVTRSLKFPITSSTTTATLPEPVDNATILCDGTTGTFKIGPTSTDITNAESNATAAAASAAAAAASETNAANSAASNNIASPTASKHGALLYQNDDDDGYDALLSQGTSAQVLTSNGPDAAPSWQDSVDLPLPIASKYGALLHQNDDDDGYDLLSGQGTSGDVLTSAGADAVPTWETPTTGTVTSVTVNAGTGLSGGGTITTSGTATLNLSTDSQQGLVKAWGQYDGTGTPSFADSYNFSSITDTAAGKPTLNFSSSMPNANYAAVASSTVSGLAQRTAPISYATGSVQIETLSGGGGATDADSASVIVIGD